jgi:hypothetical protein
MNEMKTELSPAAQAVLDAYMTGYGWLDGPCHKDCLGVAAALRAAADQVVPEGGVFLSTASAARIRAELLTIASELEGHQ